MEKKKTFPTYGLGSTESHMVKVEAGNGQPPVGGGRLALGMALMAHSAVEDM